ncbi:MAG TPA: hypothetical protein VGK48_23945 [Terriglobia bacterium]|jgi:hypothetical protein
MFLRKCLALPALFILLTGALFAQSDGIHRIAIVPLTLDQGFPLKVVITERVQSKLGEPVHGKIADPVYAFDREVIPAGTEILGKVTGLRPAGKMKRMSSMLGGDFTPLHDPEIRFDTLVFADGKTLPIDTSVVSRGNLLVRFKNGQARTYTTGTRQPVKELLHTMLWGLSPYHPQFVATGTTYKASLKQPLDFGSVVVTTRTLNGIGSEPAAGSMIYARLTTALDSKTARAGTPVQAYLSYPMYSPEHRLIFPAGSRLEGEVVSAHRAGFLAHGGELALTFTKIEPPLNIMSSASQTRDIQGRLVGVEPPVDLNQLRINDEGQAQVARTKERFLAPAFALAGAAPMLGSTPSSFAPALAEAYGSGFFSRALGGGSLFGLPGGIAGLMVPPVGLGLGAYSVGYALYFNILGHGKNITLPADTSIELRLDRLGSASE